ncbi:MAG: SGNH/GDSL hydrolase family protein [Prolixibacteraceae bacterium]|nr:SGNH/GDSL hydrolase family protein [Prolixibacteraceae bacterium]
MNISRRSFIGHAAVASAALSVPAVLQSCSPSGQSKQKVKLSKGGVILFQGDSITDAGREKTQQLPNSAKSFGNGYAFLIASALLRHFDAEQPLIYNRGISGNKVYQLAERWQSDCIDLKPEILSILIGVNDYWHMRSGNYDGTVDVYENDFRELLKTTKEKLPDVQLIICQPFILPNTSAVDESWVAPFALYQAAAEKLCREFNAIWVPFQTVFDESLRYAPATWWAADGVHPSGAGAYFMAEAWLKAVGIG